MKFKDKVVLVTGGAAGIGKATAMRFAEEGAAVVICDINETLGAETLQLLGPQASFYKVNVTNRQEVQTWVEDVVAKYGRIDVLVNNAGILRDGQLIKFKEGQLVGQMPESGFRPGDLGQSEGCVQLRPGGSCGNGKTEKRCYSQCDLGRRVGWQLWANQLRGDQIGRHRHDQGLGT